MAYVPDCERLSDALQRVMASGVSEDQAKSDITRAVGDKKIRTRLTVVIEPDPLASWHRTVQTAQGLGPRPEWKRLPDAVARLAAIGIDEAQARRDVCRAIAERRVKLRVRVKREEGVGSFGEHVAGTVRSGGEVEIPTDLNPDDLDWQQSRPLKPWRDARQGHSALSGLWHIEWIELLIPHDNESVDYFEGSNVKVPPHLKPADFDWEASRPLQPWPVRRHGARRLEWQSFSHPAVLIELRASDVKDVLCAGMRMAQHSTTTAAQESTAIKALAAHLRSNPDLKRDDGFAWCRAQRYDLSVRGYRNRVWPLARKEAELSVKGTAGRKRKSAR